MHIPRAKIWGSDFFVKKSRGWGGQWDLSWGQTFDRVCYLNISLTPAMMLALVLASSTALMSIWDQRSKCKDFTQAHLLDHPKIVALPDLCFCLSRQTFINRDLTDMLKPDLQSRTSTHLQSSGCEAAPSLARSPCSPKAIFLASWNVHTIIFGQIWKMKNIFWQINNVITRLPEHYFVPQND